MGGINLKKEKSTDEIPWRREWGCPMTKNRSSWCFGMCVPQDGKGDCGRIAPHSLIGRTERAIIRYRARKAEEQSGPGTESKDS